MTWGGGVRQRDIPSGGVANRGRVDMGHDNGQWWKECEFRLMDNGLG